MRLVSAGLEVTEKKSPENGAAVCAMLEEMNRFLQKKLYLTGCIVQ